MSVCMQKYWFFFLQLSTDICIYRGVCVHRWEHAVYTLQPSFSFLSPSLIPPFPLLNTITNFISCAPGSLISPPHNDSGPQDTFHLLSHTIKPHKIVWQLLTNHGDRKGLEMFSLCGILYPTGLLVIVVSVCLYLWCLFWGNIWMNHLWGVFHGSFLSFFHYPEAAEIQWRHHFLQGPSGYLEVNSTSQSVKTPPSHSPQRSITWLTLWLMHLNHDWATWLIVSNEWELSTDS